MGSFIVKEDKVEVLPEGDITRKQRRIGYLKQFALGFIACMANFTIGVHNSNTSITIEALTSPEAFIVLNTVEQSVFATMSSFFGIIGGFSAAPLVMMVGPKSSVVVFLLLSCIGGCLTVLAQNAVMLCVARGLYGLGDGSLVFLLSTYIGDISESEIRGRLLLLPLFLGTVGGILCYFAGSFLSWWTLQVLILALTVTITFAVFILPESPMWLISKGRKQDARTSLKKARPEEYDVDDELNNIPPQQKEKPYFILLVRLFKKFKNVKPFLFMLTINILQYMCGGIILLIFGSVIMADVKDMINPSMAASIATMVQLVGISATFLLIDKYGRKPLLMLSALITGLAWLGIAAFTYVQYNYPLYADGKEYLKFVAVLLNMLGTGLGIRFIPGLLMSETMPKEVSAVGMSIVSGIKYLSLSVVLPLFLYMNNHYRQGEIYFIYAGICFLTLIFCNFCITETNQKTLREIETLFEKKRTFFEMIVPSMKELEEKIDKLDDFVLNELHKNAEEETVLKH